MIKISELISNMRFTGRLTVFILVHGIIVSFSMALAQDVITNWTKVSGPGDVIFEDASDPKTRVKFSKAGTYVLRLTATIGQKTTTDDTTVVVTDPVDPPPVDPPPVDNPPVDNPPVDNPPVDNPPVDPPPVDPPPVDNPPAAPTTINWPIEVMGPQGTIESVPFRLPENVNTSQYSKVWFKTHNVTYDGKMSFSINGGTYISVTRGNTVMRKMDHIAGGIGGGHSTLVFTMSIPNNLLKPGNNKIDFKFQSRIAEGSSGYRVLKFNFLNSANSLLLDNAQFVESTPSSWGPIHTSNADIAEGKRLWETAGLTHPGFPQGHIIRAKCADCHSRDGRDLKYFNYSNKSIVKRSQFHGLTQKQGEQIASYIRTLPFYASPKARPWHPPYQPGPGLDSAPLRDWSAGAGEDAVLDDFEQMYPYLFPEAVDSNGNVDPSRVTGQAVSINGKVNLREIPIPLQLPDWNSWLPTIHPLDSTGDFFLNHEANTRYITLRERAVGFVSRDEWFFFQNAVSNYAKIDNWPNYPAEGSHNLHASPRHSRETYDVALWAMVKSWEVMMDKELEGIAGQYYSRISPIAEERGWFSAMPFFTSPNMLGLPHENHALRDGSKVTRFYYSYIWYHLQGILHAGQGVGNPITPVDWPYIYGFMLNMPFSLDKTIHPIKPSPLTFLWLSKINQLSNNGKKPSRGFNSSPQIHLTQPKTLFGGPNIEDSYYSNYALHKKSIEVLINNWLSMIQKHTPDEWQQNDKVEQSAPFTYPANDQQMSNLYYNPSQVILNIFYAGHKVKQMGLPASLHQRMKSVLQPIFRGSGIPWNQF